MRLPPPPDQVPPQLWWIGIVVLLVAVYRAARSRGWRGEAFVKRVSRRRLPAESYRPLHNVTLPTPDGTTQIDHIFVSRFGIFVVETKNMSGWIFGGESQAQWTQTIYRRSFKFQNPLRQNFKHVKAVQAASHVPYDAIHSVIVFVGRSTFKSSMPRNVTRRGDCFTYIESFRNPVLTNSEVERALSAIEARRLPPTRQTRREHVQSVRSRADPLAARRCPRCGNPMVVRTAKRGSNAGTRFWGCSTYPACRARQSF